VSRPVVIGAGHNGLTTAFYLARAGLKPLVLEARDIVGGCAITEPIASGYACPALAHTIGPLRPAIVTDMQLLRRGVEFVRPEPRLVALAPEGRALAFYRDAARTAAGIRKFSTPDAVKYLDFCETLERVAAFASRLMDMTPPSLDAPTNAELWTLLKTGRQFRSLGRKDAFRLLRWGPMAAADFVAEWFETEILQATVAARGIFGGAQGPWSAGTAAVLLLNAAHDPAPGGSSVAVKGGPGVLTRAMSDAAREAGAEIRTGSPVARILVRAGSVTGVVLHDGTEIPASTVISNADPRRTFLGLVDPIDLDPTFLSKVRNYRCAGAVAKVNLALSGMPSFEGVPEIADLGGRIHIGPTIDYLERAFDASKYGEISAEPYLDITVPTLHDPSLAPPGKHVMSVHVQFAPYHLAAPQNWNSAKDTLMHRVIETIDRYAPGIDALIEHHQIITPVELEGTYGLTGGHIFHGEQALDQLFTMRPFLGFARYRGPLTGLYLCGAGTHPGGGITGAPGRNAAREILEDLE
jgi:phytoene dehydrogenase-like protein